MPLTVDLIRLQLQETHPCFSSSTLAKDAKIELQGVTFHGLEPLCCCEAPIFHWGESKHYEVAAYYFPASLANPFFSVSKSQLVFFDVCRDNKRGELRKTEAAEPLGTTRVQTSSEGSLTVGPKLSPDNLACANGLGRRFSLSLTPFLPRVLSNRGLEQLAKPSLYRNPGGPACRGERTLDATAERSGGLGCLMGACMGRMDARMPWRVAGGKIVCRVGPVSQ